MSDLSVWAICATKGRHTLLERSLRLFLEQDYEGEHTLLIFNNSDTSQVLHLPDKPKNKHVILVNSDIDSKTNERYTSLGAIYNDAIKIISPTCDLITHWDDDDLFLPDHISEGVKGFKKGKLSAYKPSRSYYRSSEGIALTANNLEPSIFVENWIIQKYGYSLTTTEQHLNWLSALQEQNEIFVDPDGKPTLIYNWGDTIPTFKTSGDFHNPQNFKNYTVFSQDHGDGIVAPWSLEKILPYYKEVETYASKCNS